jgi:transposase
MDFLEANKAMIEKALYYRLGDLFHLDVDVIFYDTTSLHFEVDDEDRGVGEEDVVWGSQRAGHKKYKAPRKRGYSKNGLDDVPQIVVGLAVSRDGLPVRHWVFPGNTVDVTTVETVKGDLRGWKLGRCLFVGDAGMVSAENLRTLALGGGKYIVCMPLKPGSEVTTKVINRPGRYQQVADNLRVKQVVVGEGERRRRYVVCHNPEEQKRQRKHRAQVLTELEAELAVLADLDSSSYTKRVFELLASRRYGRYLRRTKSGKLRLDRAALSHADKLDGKFVVHSNDDTLTAEDMALGYKQLMRVELAWRQLKSGLRMRPVFHWAPHRIHAHIFLTVLALLLERIAEQACGDTWHNIRDDLKQIKLVQLSRPNGTIWQVTAPQIGAANRLKSLGISNLPTLLDYA